MAAFTSVRDISGRGRLGAVLAGVLLAAGCGDDPAADGGDTAEVVMPEPVPQREPSALRMIDGPPGPALAERTHEYLGPRYLVAALGTDEVVVGAFDGVRPRAFFVGSVDGGGWERIDPPPVEGEMEAELVTVGQDAVLVGAPCPGELNPESDEQPECPAGYEGLGVWRLDHEDRQWSTVALVPEEDLELHGSNTGIPPDTRWWWRVLGVVDDAVAVAIEDSSSRVVTVDMIGAVDIPYEWDAFARPATHAQARCITGSGALVGIGGDGDGMSGNAVRATNLGFTHVAVHLPDGDGWTVFDNVTFTGAQSLGCGADQVSIVGETDVSLEVAEWRVVDLSGGTLSQEPLAEDAVLGPDADFTLVSFFDRKQHFPAAGRNRMVVVRDFGDQEIIDAADMSGDFPDRYPVILPRRVVVLPRPGAPTLTHEFPPDKRVQIEGTTTLPDGMVIALIHRSTDWNSNDDEFSLLIAE